MRPAVALLMMVLVPAASECFAQQPTEKETYQEIATRLEEAQRALSPPVGAYRLRRGRHSRDADAPPPPPPAGVETAIKSVEALATYLRGNPYVQLKGFKVKVGFPPGLDVDFEVPPQSAPVSPGR